MKKKLKVLASLVMGIAVLFLGAFPVSAMDFDKPGLSVLYPSATPGVLEISWVDKADATESNLYFGENADLSSVQTVVGTSTYGNEAGTGFTGEMTGLVSGRSYYYQVGRDDDKSKVYSFVYQPKARGEEATMLYMGDVQVEAAPDYEAWRSLLANAESLYGGSVGLTMFGGDTVVTGQKFTDWQDVFGYGEELLSKVPTLAVPGNHESRDSATGKPELMTALMPLPENGISGFNKEFYSYDYGDAHIVALNSNVFYPDQIWAGVMTEDDYARIEEWIRSDIEASDAKWNIVVLHHPAYMVVNDRVARRVNEEWLPLFEEVGVDLILTGHQHVYMRTPSLLGGEKNDQGLVQIMGNAGSVFLPPRENPYSEVMLENVSTYQAIKITGDSLNVKTHDSSGAILDEVTLTQGIKEDDKEVTPSAIVDFTKEIISGLVPSENYDVNGEVIPANENGELVIAEKWMGNTISLIKKGNEKLRSIDSDPLAIAIPQRPATPVVMAVNATKVGSADGKIQGVKAGMVYQTEGSATWQPIVSEEVTALAKGVYFVKVQATSSDFASLSAQVVIGEDVMPLIIGEKSGTIKTTAVIPKTGNGTIVYAGAGLILIGSIYLITRLKKKIR